MEALSPGTSLFLWFFQLLMGLGGPAVAPAPDVAEVQRYAVQDSTHFVYLHLGAVLPNGHTFLKGLTDVSDVQNLWGPMRRDAGTCRFGDRLPVGPRYEGV